MTLVFYFSILLRLLIKKTATFGMHKWCKINYFNYETTKYSYIMRAYHFINLPITINILQA